MKSGGILLYQNGGDKEYVSVVFQDGTFWLTKKVMPELFDTSKQNISLHLKNCFEEEELEEKAAVKEFLTTAADEKNYKTKFYNQDAEYISEFNRETA